MTPLDSTRAPRTLVVGCGAIGGSICARLVEQGVDLTALSRNELVADAINASGFRTRGELSVGDVPGHAMTTLPSVIAPFDLVLLATQPNDVEQAARLILPHLTAEAEVVCLQNGLCEQRVADIVGPERVIGAVVAWGASMPEPGVYDRTAAGGFTLGRLDGAPADRLQPLVRLLETLGPVALTRNLVGARWSKLAINCAISSLGAIGGDRLGVLLRRRRVRRLALEIITEAVGVALAEGVEIEPVAGTLDLAWLALSSAERDRRLGCPSLLAKHALMLAVGSRFRRLRSSMLRAMEQGRPVAVDYLNGEVVERGERAGVPVAVNRAVREQVRRIASGQARSAPEELDALFARTRDPTPAPPPHAQADHPAEAQTQERTDEQAGEQTGEQAGEQTAATHEPSTQPDGAP